MLKESQESLAYLKFLNLAKAVRESPEFGQLSLIEERMLNNLVASWRSQETITVVHAMRVDTEVSLSTAHRLLKNLRLKKFITLETDEADMRVKYVLPTPLASRYFEALGRCLEEAGVPSPDLAPQPLQAADETLTA